MSAREVAEKPYTGLYSCFMISCTKAYILYGSCIVRRWLKQTPLDCLDFRCKEAALSNECAYIVGNTSIINLITFWG